MRRLALTLPLFLFTGCISVSLEGVDRTAYRLVESGQAKTFHVVNVESHSRVIPAAARFDVVLVERVPEAGDRGALFDLRDQTPPHRRVDKISTEIGSLARHIPRGGPRWLVSVDPLVVAVDTKAAPGGDASVTDLIGAGPARTAHLRLIRQQELGQTVDAAFRIDGWPPARYGDIPTVTPVPVGGRRTLDELMNARPWARAP